jgi:hypothetical protein
VLRDADGRRMLQSPFIHVFPSIVSPKRTTARGSR